MRQLGILICLSSTACYLVFRAGWTMNLETAGNAFLSVGLLLGESWGAILLSLHLFQVWKLDFPEFECVSPDDQRSVDVLIPTVDEDLVLVAGTIRAANAISYPHETWVLDDGPRAEVQAVCEQLGVRYLRRPDRKGFKAGNLNHALEHTEGELVAVLDADHWASPDFLDRTIPAFRDPRVAFVQTPHISENPGITSWPTWFGESWDIDDIFHRVVQLGKRHWNAVTYCGGAAVLRRAALEDVGGFAEETITEDLHTGLRMHALGWRGEFVDEPLCFGQAADNWPAFSRQRNRWGQGNLSVLRHDHPARMAGLTIAQRIAYLASLASWTTGWAKTLLYATPVIAGLTGWSPILIQTPWLGAAVAGHVFILWTTLKFLHRGRMRLVGTEISQMLMSGIDIANVLKVAMRTDERTFRTTPKGANAPEVKRSRTRWIPLPSPQTIWCLGALVAVHATLWRIANFGGNHYSWALVGINVTVALVAGEAWRRRSSGPGNWTASEQWGDADEPAVELSVDHSDVSQHANAVS